MKFTRVSNRPVFIKSDQDWSRGTLAGYDCETSGIDPKAARIVSASLVIDTLGSNPTVHEWLLNPDVEIELGATAVHGINTEYARTHGMNARKGIAEIITILERVECPLVVVNAAFDMSILIREAMRYDMDAQFVIDRLHILDTLVLDRMLEKFRPGRRSLTAASAAHGVVIRGAHTSTGDVMAAIKLARALGRKYPDLAWCDLDVLMRIQAKAYRDWGLSYEDFRRIEEPYFTVAKDWPYRIPLMVER